jgi:diguanylate cyclase (GGDEF)-like protein
VIERSGLDSVARRYWAPAAILLLGVVALTDYVTGNELSFSLFYLLPISVVAWYGDRQALPVTCSVGAAAWLLVEVLSGQQYSHILIFIWNAGIRFGLFAIVAGLLSNLRTELEGIRELARSDYLTGAVSPGYFYELLQREIDRCNRTEDPFTLAYLDLDDFKKINDQLGHPTGDEVLRRVVARAKGRLRKTDILARLGGDEYAILLPETDEKAARAVLPDVQQVINREMQANGWTLTVSVGAVTFASPPPTPNEGIRLVDQLMYSVKKSGKDSIRFSTFPDC